MAAVDTNVKAPNSLSTLFLAPVSEKCQRCNQRVYQVEKVGPIKEVIFHRQCFRCTKCTQVLTLKTYYTNFFDLGDHEIYCSKCVPESKSAGLGIDAMGIRGAMKATNMSSPQAEQYRGIRPNIGADARFISHPVHAQSDFQRRYKQSYNRHNFPAYLGRAKEKVHKAQVELEKQQREEEDRLLNLYQAEKRREEEKLKSDLDAEWEVKLKELTAQFEGSKRGKSDNNNSTTDHYEQEREVLKKNMTVKMQKQQEAMTLRLQKKVQQDTAMMVTEHSQQMLELLKSKQDEIKEDLIKSAKEEGEEMDPSEVEEALQEAIQAIELPKEQPPPHPPKLRKRDLYYDPSVFTDLDNDVIRVAEREHGTFTELVGDLTMHCVSDLQKARAIFRWITVKDLNVLDFDQDNMSTDTPMGLLRGIKFGTETYHTLFMRLCGYCGLACREIKGHSKSVGYEPGMKIREDTFQNTWNAVLIDDNWWPVQCNWGARHLVLNKDVNERQPKPKKQDKIRYQYDEHYFLCDPDEFIREFWASDPDWQLLDKSVSLEEFEAMPFVRSVFFHYGLDFDQLMKAVLYTDNKGGAEVKINVPFEYAKDLVFHYQIRFADRERRNDTEYRGAKLERFVFHSLVDNIALFSVHVPAAASYFLEVFANKIDETNKIGDDPNATMMPFRLKCACKFKIVCDELVGKMHPLPNCASGEWGPSKGKRHFGIRPITHSTGVINVDNDTEVRFKLPRKLHFLCKLRMNGVDDNVLEKFVAHVVNTGELIIKVGPPQTGQYGLDIYARPEDAADNHTLAHACKYLLNCTKVDQPIEIPVSKVDGSSKMAKERWGPAPSFEELGLKTLSHKEPKIENVLASSMTIELSQSETLKYSVHLIREPDEDCRNAVTMKESGKKVKFNLSLPKPGAYLFAVYARRKKDPENAMQNVYNYMILYKPDESTLKKKKGKSIFSKK